MLDMDSQQSNVSNFPVAYCISLSFLPVIRELQHLHFTATDHIKD